MIEPIKRGRVLIAVFGLILAATALAGTGIAFADDPPNGCRIDPVGNLICQGTAVATIVPRGTPQPTRPLPTRPPTETPPTGTYYMWRYCIPDSASPTGYWHARYICDSATRQCSPDLITLIVAYNCGTPTPTTLKVNPLPCPAKFTQTGISCLIGWVRRAEARIPPVPITYRPYPRGIVNDTIEFTAPPFIVQDWACTSPQVDNWNPRNWGYDEDYRNLVFCIRWRQVAAPDPSPDPAPAWIRYVWDERAWGQPKEDTSRQQTTEHLYVTSSAQKVENGPARLPSYQVEARSYWVIDWRMTWEHAFRWTECIRTRSNADVCEGQRGFQSVQRVEWRGESDDGTADLRDYGAAHFYADSTLVRTPDGRVLSILPVPVIEVQGVIGNPPR
jgi:hypothetical protein